MAGRRSREWLGFPHATAGGTSKRVLGARINDHDIHVSHWHPQVPRRRFQRPSLQGYAPARSAATEPDPLPWQLRLNVAVTAVYSGPRPSPTITGICTVLNGFFSPFIQCACPARPASVFAACLFELPPAIYAVPSSQSASDDSE